MTEKLWYLKRCDLFERLTDDELRAIEGRSRHRIFARRAPIYLPADAAQSVYLLTSGRAKICHLTPDGKQSILAFVEPGELFGELAAIDGSTIRDEYAEATEATEVMMIPNEVFQDLMHRYPGVSIGITKLIGMRRKRVERRLKNLLFLSNRDRVTHLLLELAEQYGRNDGTEIQLGIKLSHQDLANVIGSTRETVTVVLGEMQDEGLIRVGRRKIVLREVKKLASAVQRPLPDASSPDSQGARLDQARR